MIKIKGRQLAHTRAGMLASGIALLEKFCAVNDFTLPQVTVIPKSVWRLPSTCAYYRKGMITICPDRCSLVGTANRAWSYPGYVTDRTPHGVLAHELGHHVDYVCSAAPGAYGGDFSVNMRKASGEPKLTSYCPNDWEWFAEMFRLFATNSDLLRCVRPKTYRLILAAGIEPVETRPWGAVLIDAPERTRLMAERKAR